MARVPISFTGRVKGGPARGGLGRECRFYTDDTLAVAKQLFRREAVAGLQPVVIIPNAGIPRALAANRAGADAFVTVAIGQTGSFNVGDLIPIWNAVQGTVYRVITAINAGTGQIDLDSALGIAFTVANGTQVNATDMEGHVWGWADDATATWMQVKELGSNRLLAPVKVSSAPPVFAIAVQEEGGAVNSRPTMNFIGRSVTATDDGANNRVNVTIGIAGSEAAPAPEVLADTDTGLWGETGNILSIVGFGKRIAKFVGNVSTSPNYYQLQNSGTGGSPFLSVVGVDSDIPFRIGSSGTGSVGLYSGGGARSLALFTDATSAVNYVSVSNSATGSVPFIGAAGTDGTISHELRAKGNGSSVYLTQAGSPMFQAIGVASMVDYFTATGTAAGGSVVLASAGSDASVNVNIVAKGAAGAVYLDGGKTDYGNVQGGTGAWTFTAAGGSAAVSINLVPKGTGVLQYKGAQAYPLLTAEAELGADVTTPTSNTWQDGPSVSLAANRVWLIVCQCQIRVGGLTYTAVRLYDGTTVEASATYQGQAASTGYANLPLVGLVTIGGSAATWKIQTTGTTGGTGGLMSTDAGSSGPTSSGTNATRILAICVG